MFNIEERLKHINKDYRVVRNNRLDRWEVHTKELEFVVPYDKLDSRVLEHARRTRKQNSDSLEREIDTHNQGIEKAAVEKRQLLQNDLEDMLGFALRTGHTVSFTKDYVKEF
jgi:septal ring factor EnvC (AmiA/AmiB activator)